MNIFLTGERGIGKSTIIAKVIKYKLYKCCGFKTRFNGLNGETNLYMASPNDKEYKALNIVARKGDFGLIADIDRFNTLGSQLATNLYGDIVIMDELGFLEKDALIFRDSVFNTLNSSMPVLGVIRLGFPSWTKEITKRSDTRIFTIDINNRDTIIDKIIDLLGEA